MIKVSQSQSPCIPITFLGLEEFEKKKEIERDDVISLMSQRLCLIEKKQIREISIQFRKIDFAYISSFNILKHIVYLWYIREIFFSYELEYSLTDKKGKIISGNLKKEVSYKVMEFLTIPFYIFGLIAFEKPPLFVLLAIHPYATSNLFGDVSYFSLYQKAIEQMADNLTTDIFAKTNPEVKE